MRIGGYNWTALGQYGVKKVTGGYAIVRQVGGRLVEVGRGTAADVAKFMATKPSWFRKSKPKAAVKKSGTKSGTRTKTVRKSSAKPKAKPRKVTRRASAVGRKVKAPTKAAVKKSGTRTKTVRKSSAKPKAK